MTTLVAQLGARRHYAVPRALHQAGSLYGLVTDICADVPPWSWMRKLVPRAARPDGLNRLLGRHAEGIPPRLIRNLTSFALSWRLRRQPGETLTLYWARRNRAFGRVVVKEGFGGAACVYGFNGAAYEIFEAAKAQGLRAVLDQTAAPWRFNCDLLVDEMARFPGWEEAPKEIDFPNRLAEREEREWALADAIVCGSQFAADAIAACGGPIHKLRVVPYAGHVAPWRGTERPPLAGRKLRVLFVGSLQLRKGVQYVAEVVQKLKGAPVEFRLVGKSSLSRMAEDILSAHAHLTGAVPRDEVAGHYAWADVFLLPTLSEGSANVVYEAMAAGLPVVTTANAGSVIGHGHDGFILPIRNPAAIAEALLLLAADSSLRAALGVEAQRTIARGNLQQYAGSLASLVDRI